MAASFRRRTALTAIVGWLMAAGCARALPSSTPHEQGSSTMLSSLKRLISGNGKAVPTRSRKDRREAYETFLEEPEYVFEGKDDTDTLVEAYGRDFAPEGSVDESYVLLSNGMSDQQMAIPEGAGEEGIKPRAELMWYVREPTPEIVANLRWLTQFPFIDKTFIGFGHRIPMPTPPLSDCPFKTFLFLRPIICDDELLSDTVFVDNEKVDILTVHLISDAEYAFIKSKGLDPFLDMLDENDYPPIFDPKRPSYI